MFRKGQATGTFDLPKASNSSYRGLIDCGLEDQQGLASKRLPLRAPRHMATEEVISTKHALLNSVIQVAENHVYGNLKLKKSRIRTPAPQTPQCRRLSDSALESQLWTAISEASPKSIKGQIREISLCATKLLSLLEENLDVEKPGKKDKTYKFLIEGLLKEKTPDFSQLEKLAEKELSQELITCAIASKEASMSLQAFISECSGELVITARKALLQHARTLIVHKFGSYVLQRLITRDSSSMEFISNLCQADFVNLMKDEFASRVLQLLIECSPQFRVQAIKNLKTHFFIALESGAASHLLKACIKNSTKPEELSFITQFMEQYPALISSKLFRNVLMAYMQACSQVCLNRIAVLLRLEHRFLFYLNSKSFTSILFLLLERGEKLTKSLFFGLLRSCPLRVFACRCLQLLISWILGSESGQIALVQELGNYLARLPSSVILRFQDNGILQYYLYVVLSCFKDNDPCALAQFLSKPNISEFAARLSAKTAPHF